ncbi:hypothetical protein SMC44_002690 [Cronobacter malonaticus]|nr:hypothetical protein [Cronobacter malonaticus]
MDKSREQFEARVKSETGLNLDRTNYALSEVGEQQYIDHDTNLAWWAWQASRAAVEVEFPEVEKWRSPEAVRAQRAMLVLVKQAISGAGLKVKGE